MVSQWGIEFIQRNEIPNGVLSPEHLKVFDDGHGYPTIGWGHLCSSWDEYPDGISKEQAAALFDQDLTAHVQPIKKYRFSLNQAQRDALADFVYNIGGNNWRKSMSRAAAEDGRWGYVPVGFFEFTKSGGKRSKGLIRRRLREFLLWHYEDYGFPVTRSA